MPLRLSQKFPWGEYLTIIDIGTTQGSFPVQVALAQEYLTGGGFNLPAIRPFFTSMLATSFVTRYPRQMCS